MAWMKRIKWWQNIFEMPHLKSIILYLARSVNRFFFSQGSSSEKKTNHFAAAADVVVDFIGKKSNL